MAISTQNKKTHFITRSIIVIGLLYSVISTSLAQSVTSWKGTGSAQTGTDWSEPTNWTNGAPDATKHVIIGDANFTGSRMPVIDLNAQAACLSLTIGGSNAVKLKVSNDKGLNVGGNLVIQANGELENEGSHITIGGNWTNNGVYNELLYIKGNINSRSTQYPKVELTGSSSRIGGSSTNSFNFLIASGNLTLENNINLVSLTKGSNTVQPTLQVKGVFDPSIYLVNLPTVSGTTFTVEAGATLLVKANTLVNGASFFANYTIAPTTIYTNSVIDYAGGDQVVENGLPFSYGILRISGSGTKTLEGNTTVFGAQGTGLIINSGTLDIATFTLDRSSSPGGSFTIASGATLRIGGTNTLPANYVTYTLDPNSTVEYYGTNQTVTNVTYGHLLLSNSGLKSMPATAMTVAGNLTSTGTVSYTAGASITVNGNVTIGTGTTFNGGNASHTIAGNWAANGTYVGGSSTVTMTGTNRTISSTAGSTEFNNLTLSGIGTNITVPTLTIRGNLNATGGLSQVADGTITMTNAASRSISGSGMNFQNLTIDGTVTTTSSFTLNGNLLVNAAKSFAASAGTVTMAGANKSISGTGSISFWGLNTANTTTTASSFTVNSSLNGTSSLTATTGTATFAGTSTFAGTHFLNNVAVTGTSLSMLANANLYINGAMSLGGGSAFNVSATPNSVYYNSSNPQTVLSTNYHHLILANTGAKTAGGAITVNGNFTLASGSAFNAGAFNHTLNGNWTNNGTFSHGSGTITFAGSTDTSINGETLFNTLVLNKSSMARTVTLASNVTASNLQMTNGTMITGVNKVTLLSNRTGNGWVIGTVTRNHTFADGVSYAFNGPYAMLSFVAPVGLNEVSMMVAAQSIGNFTAGTAISRKYTIATPAGTYSSGTLQLQYEDTELNGNTESALKLYNYDAGLLKWRSYGRTNQNSTQNWVSKAGLSNISGEWTLSSSPGTYSWVGGNSSAWENAANWQDITEGVAGAAASAPLSTDVAILGEANPVNHPVINSAATISSMQFRGTAANNLTISSGSLNVLGNLTASGAGTAIVHTLTTGNNSLVVGGNLVLNDGSVGNAISLVNGTGSVTVTGNIEHPAGGSISLGSGNLSVGGNYNYTAGAAFAAGTGTVTYNGTVNQTVAGLPYHHLMINKANTSTAAYTSGINQSITGNLTVSGLGKLSLSVPVLNVAGNVSITGSNLEANASAIDVKGNWSTATGSSFTAGSSTVTFSGSAIQTVSATTFNNLTVNKSQALTTGGNLALTGNLNIQAGTLEMNSHTVNRTTAGGTLQLANGATILTKGTVGFPGNFSTNSLAANSTVVYDAGASSIASLNYGNLTVQGSGSKSLLGNLQVAGNMVVGPGAAIAGNTLANLTIAGNLQNNGSVNTVRASLVFSGAGGQISGTGSTVIDNLTVNAGASLAINKNIRLQGNLNHNGAMLDASAAELDFAGGGAASINSAGSPFYAGSLKISKANATVSLNADIEALQSVAVTGGTFNIASRTLAKATGASGTSFTVADGATLMVGGTNTLPVFDSYTFGPVSTMMYNGSTQTVKALQYGHLTLSNTGTKTFETGTTGIAGNLLVNSGATAEMLSNSSVVAFNGTGSQAIAAVNYHTLQVSGGSEKTLAGNATIADKLELLNGRISTGANKFILGNAATIVESEGNYVTGLVEAQRTVGTDPESFGDIGFSIDADVAPGVVTVIRETGAVVGLNSNSARRNFNVLPGATNQNLNAIITLSYLSHELNSIPESNLSVYTSTDNVYWTLQPEANTVRTPTRQTVALSGVNSLSRFTLGDRFSPLPIELAYFKAEKKGDSAILTWATTSEKENLGFDVEVSIDGKKYRKIGFVSQGTGTSSVVLQYTFTDNEAGKHGMRYYRLKQLDLDGSYTYYGPKAVDFGALQTIEASAYPNPFQQQINLVVPAQSGGVARIRLYNAAGRVMLEMAKTIEAGTNNIGLDPGLVPAGMYVLTVEAEGRLQRLKLLKE